MVDDMEFIDLDDLESDNTPPELSTYASPPSSARWRAVLLRRVQ